MLSANKIKCYTSLKQKKYRDKHLLFSVEGAKIIQDLLAYKAHTYYKLEEILISEESLDNPETKSLLQQQNEILITTVPYATIKKISSLQTPSNSIAIVRKPENTEPPPYCPDSPCFLLDGVQDPGNLGTIIRSSAWFGIQTLYCSKETVDLFNPKVLQASMGAFLSVHVYYVDLLEALNAFTKKNKPIYGTMLGGTSVFDGVIEQGSAIVFGNEGSGINTHLLPYLPKVLTIPKYTNHPASPESLNVAISHGIVCAAMVK